MWSYKLAIARLPGDAGFTGLELNKAASRPGTGEKCAVAVRIAQYDNHAKFRTVVDVR